VHQQQDKEHQHVILQGTTWQLIQNQTGGAYHRINNLLVLMFTGEIPTWHYNFNCRKKLVSTEISFKLLLLSGIIVLFLHTASAVKRSSNIRPSTHTWRMRPPFAGCCYLFTECQVRCVRLICKKVQNAVSRIWSFPVVGAKKNDSALWFIVIVIMPLKCCTIIFLCGNWTHLYPKSLKPAH